jgi:hypothetical protein
MVIPTNEKQKDEFEVLWNDISQGRQNLQKERKNQMIEMECNHIYRISTQK